MDTRFALKDLIEQGYANVGDHTYGTPRVYPQWNNGRVLIGRFCSIADEVLLLPGGNHPVDWVSTYPFRAFQHNFSKGWAPDDAYPTSKGDIVIENDVWIAYGATITSGVTIGSGAVIGARAVVTKDVPPYAIVAGNPAKVIRYRFSDDQITALLQIAWWNWQDERINEAMELLHSNQVALFIERHCAPGVSTQPLVIS